MRQALLALITFVFPILPVYGQSFVDASTGLPRVYAQASAIGDYDADGRMDLLGYDAVTEWELTLYRNTESGFSKQAFPTVRNSSGYISTFWGDANGDGLLDVLTAGVDETSRPLSEILIQNADHTFARVQPPQRGRPAAWVDLDGNGKLDVVAEPLYHEGLLIHWCEADGSFTTTTNFGPFYYQNAVAAADLDSDGDMDLMLNLGEGRRVFRNDGFRRFTDTGAMLKSSVLRDMNADGLVDAVYSIEINPVVTSYVQFNRGSFRFEEVTLPLNLLHRISSSADFDGDSSPDFFMHSHPRAMGSDYRPIIYLNAGGTNYQPSGLVFPYVMEVKGSDLADFDNDGDIDVLAYGDDLSGENRRRFFRNNTSVQVVVPTPTNLSAVVRLGAVQLSWEALAPNSYTYNLRVGTLSGAQDVLAAASRADGVRLIPAAGNSGTSARKLLHGLAPGTYYWSVQAVDWGFRGSPFAQEGSFSIPEPGGLPGVPTISEIPNLFTDEDVTTHPVSFVVGPTETAADLQVSVESNNPMLVPAAGILISGTGSERILQITPATNQNGSAVVTVRVTDLAGRSATRSLVLIVLAINDSPVLEDIPNQIVYMGNPSLIVPLDYSDAETLPVSSGLEVSAESSDPDLIPQSALVAASDPRDFQTFPRFSNAFEIRPPTNKTGSATITVTVSDRLAVVSKSFVLTILPSAFAATNLWTNTAGINVPGADFNNDGRLDLILTTPTRNVPELYTNTGAGFAATRVLFPAPFAGGKIVTADFNRDNFLDCLIMNWDGVYFLTNSGGTNFSARLGHGLPRLEYPDITPGDLDNDGDTDVVLNGSLNGAGVFRVCYNENGVFRQSLGPLPGFRGACRIADFDQNGWNDLMLVGSMFGTRPTNGLYRAIGDGSYVYEPLPANIVNATDFGLLDVNSDGRLDLWIESGGYVEVYEYSTSGFKLVGNLEGWVAGWGDFDNDGKIDLLARVIKARLWQRNEYGFRQYRNDGEFSFTDRGDPLHDAYQGKVHVADINNDNAVDVIASFRNPTTGQPQGARLFLNKSTDLNSPPSAPNRLAATLTNGIARLSWNVASDLNQRSGLTYNVRVGTHSGGSDVLAPLSIENGRRLLPAEGNAEGRLTLLLTNLNREVYYWSVQAVDASYRGSTFAPEQKLIIDTPGNESPTVISLVSVTSGEDTEGSFIFIVDDDRTPLEDLSVRVFPSDPLVLPLKNITVEGTNSTRSVSFRPATNAFGNLHLSIVATDAVGAGSTNFVVLTITNVNDAPIIAPLTNQFSFSWKEDIRVLVNVSDTDNTADQFQFEVSSDNPVLVPPDSVVFERTNDFWFATIRAATETPGTASLTFTVFDPERASANANFQVSFTNRVFRLAEQQFAGVRHGSMAWGDMDGDGDLDLALSGQGVNQTTLYKNIGNGSFETLLIGVPAVDGGGVEWGDCDNDGDLDLLVHGRSLTYIAQIYINDGIGNLTASDHVISGLYGPGSFGDFDRDGDLDLISSGQTTSGLTSTVLYQNDKGQFVRTSDDFSAFYGAHWVDINLDGALDLHSTRLSNFGWHDVLFLQQDRQFVLTSIPPRPGSLAEWADLDLDGIPDAIANSLSRGSIGELLILKNTNNLLTTSQILLDNFRHDGTALGDYDNDGYPDLFVSGYGEGFVYKTRLFRNQTNATFQEVQTPLPHLMFSTASFADVENDGDLDLLINGQRPSPQNGYVTQLYRNDYSPSNQPPTAPTNLKAFYTCEGLILEWDAAVDQNQPGGLTYNVAVGTSPGRWDVLAPMAKASGWRMVPRAGNNGWLRWKLLTGVEPGKTYFATVQAVDNAFAGSPFAPEVSITVGQAPQIDFQFNATIDEDEVFEGEFQVHGGEDTNYVINATSSNPSLVVDSQIEIISRGSRRFVKINPNRGASGTTLITMTALDDKGGRATRTFTLTVNARNRPPVVASQALTLIEDTSITFNLGAFDPEGGALQVTNILRPRYGALFPLNDGFIYQPLTNFFGFDRCVFVVSDDHGQTNSAEISFSVNAVSDIAQAGFEMNSLFDGTVLFNLVGEPYQFYEVEFSSDLLNWSLLGVWRSPVGELPFTGNRGAPQQMIFIRAKLSQ